MTTFQPWTSTESEEVASLAKLVDKAQGFLFGEHGGEGSCDEAWVLPDGLHDAMARVHSLFRQRAGGRSSPFVLMVPTMEALEELFLDIFEDYEGPLGHRSDQRYERLWNTYMKRAKEICVKSWTSQAAEIRAFKAESEDLVALEQAPHKWAFYEMLQRDGLMPLLPVPTASVLRRLAAQVTGMEWGVYSVSGYAL